MTTWRARLYAQGITYAQWQRMRLYVASTLPAPCTVCADLVQPWQRWHLEHIVPLVKGGAALDLANLGAAHAVCNLRKGRHLSLERALIVAPSRHW